jgi:ubiquitin fusion degradation protein 1
MFDFEQLMIGQGLYPQRRTFENYYQCYSMAIVNKSNLDDGDKILLPPSALEVLSRMRVDFPMLFEIKNEQNDRRTHCGVIEFTAEEGKCHVPYFMMQNLLVRKVNYNFYSKLLYIF